MDEKQAFETFQNGLNAVPAEEESIVEFEKTYSLAVNGNNGRDAASSILTTVRDSVDADLAFTTCNSYASSIYEGGCTQRELGNICNNNKGTPLYIAELTGGDIRILIEAYLQDTGFG